MYSISKFKKRNNNYKKIVLVTGSGSIANKHIKTLLQLKYTVCSLIKSDDEKKRFSKYITKKVKFINNIKTIDSDNIFFAIIASSTHKHLNEINFFLKNRINIFCEKPISNSLKFLKKIRKKIINNKIYFYVNYQLKKSNLVKKFISEIKGNKIYHINARVGHNLKYWRKNKTRKNSYYINTRKGGGVIFELVHEINLIRHIFGDILKIKTIKNKNLLKNAEDQALSLFKTKKNIPGILIQDMLSEKKERYLEVLTPKNSIKLDFIKNKIFTFNNRTSKTIKNKKEDQLDLIKMNIKSYINWIKKGKFDIKFFDEAVRDLIICNMMHEKF